MTYIQIGKPETYTPDLHLTGESRDDTLILDGVLERDPSPDDRHRRYRGELWVDRGDSEIDRENRTEYYVSGESVTINGEHIVTLAAVPADPAAGSEIQFELRQQDPLNPTYTGTMDDQTTKRDIAAELTPHPSQ